MMLVSFPLAFLVIRTVKETNYNDEKVRHSRYPFAGYISDTPSSR